MPTNSRPIGTSSNSQNSLARSPFSSSYLSGSPLAQASIERDIAEGSEDDAAVTVDDDEEEGSSSEEESETSTVRPSGGQSHSMASSFRRPSFIAFGATRPTITPHPDVSYLTKRERSQARKEERSLLRDNHLAPPKHHRERAKSSIFARLYRRMFSTKLPKSGVDAEAVDPNTTAEPSENSALLVNGGLETARERHERRNRQWEAAVAAGKIKTTWQRETKVLLKYASPLVVTFLLQYSLTVASIFTVGHIGKLELGAVRYVQIRHYQLNLTT